MNTQVLQQLKNKLVKNRVKQLSDAELNLLNTHSTAVSLIRQTYEVLFKFNKLTWPLTDEEMKLIMSLSSLKKIPRYIKLLILYNTSYPNTTEFQHLWLFVHNYTPDNMPKCETCNKLTTWSVTKKKYKQHCSNKCRSIDPEVEAKRKKTCEDKYGHDKSFKNSHHLNDTRITCKLHHEVDYPFQNNNIRIKSEATKEHKYGSDYKQVISTKTLHTLQKKHNDNGNFGEVLSRSDIIKKRNVNRLNTWLPKRQEKFAPSAIPLYDNTQFTNRFSILPYHCTNCGNEFYDDIRDGTIPRCLTCNPLKQSIEEDNIALYINNLGIKCVKHDRDILKPKELDIYIPTHNLAIEYNGLYWHSEIGSRNRVNKNYHRIKTDECINKGIKLLQLFEDEWLFKQDIVCSIILGNLGLHKSVYGRQCSVVELSSKEGTQFLIDNHIQGVHTGTHNIGLIHDNKLVSIMVFGKSRFNKQVEYELYRFCSLININVIGGASKMFKYFITKYNPRSVISYADRRLFNGAVYKQLGFEYSKTSSNGYWYVDMSSGCKTRLNRQQFQKHKLKKVLQNFEPHETEVQNMERHNFSRIWDCGQLVFIWSK